ncbi:SDR family NAD(P)-dependent oxidoreductase [Psychrobacter sp. FDAARGOS_221]|uniref:SDR family NAD(P)-dependent oxidoreductase n=1 Tax=Psychrobacter sp. FDAARGOS_221 TaxID=1975705 RepID=UPI000BB57557|nr:SDR family NAD(P)-dependent oxidoreductase [Psychrobacter sp. FDAARGOS_221]PNK59616.1 hypothetical protein A6J60_001105 [Psychrobacter sp. FDAARGOS_221]
MTMSLNLSLLQSKTKPIIVIIGGTSGVGLALAKEHQKLGWQVVVVGSNLEKIEALRTAHPDLHIYQCDITDIGSRIALLSQLEDLAFTRLIYCAGWYLNERVHQLDKVDSARMLAINLQAFHAVFDWASRQLMAKSTTEPAKNDCSQQVIQPALICLSSMAGVVNYPYASLYAKCKRAMIATASAYRLALAPFGIQVNCMAMGYVNTQTLRDLNYGDASHKPFIMEEHDAVAHIMQAISSNDELAIFPKKMRFLTHALNKLPSPVLNWAMRQKLDK